MNLITRGPEKYYLAFIAPILAIAISLGSAKPVMGDHPWLDKENAQTFGQLPLLKILASTDGMTLDFPISYQTAFRQIVESGQFNGSSGGGGPQAWRYDGEIRKVANVSYQYGDYNSGQTRKGFKEDGIPLTSFKDTYVFQIHEQIEPFRRVFMAARKNGYLFIAVESQVDDGFFQFEVSPKQGVRCHTTDTGRGTQFSAPSFDKFCRQFPDLVSKTIQPTFDWLGLGEIPSVYSKTTQQFVLNSIVGPAPERINRFKTLVAGMDANTFQKREQASKQLEENFDEWKEMVDWAINAEDFSPEVKRRLEKIAQAKGEPNQGDRRRSILRLNLVDNADYLIWLLEKTREAPNTSDSRQKLDALVNQLSRLTGENLGDDIEAWKAWGQPESDSRRTDAGEDSKPTDGSKKSDASPDSDVDVTTTPLEFMSFPGSKSQQLFRTNLLTRRGSTDIARLVPLAVDEEGKLILDERRWAEPYNNRPVEDVVSEIEELLKRQNLPQHWFQPGGGYSMQTTSHVHLSFARLSGSLNLGIGPNASVSPQHVVISHNREFNHRGLAVGRLKFHEEDGRKMAMRRAFLKNVPAKDFFHLEIASAHFPFESVVVRHIPGKSLQIMVSAVGLGQRFSVRQTYDDEDPACSFYVRRGGQISTASAKDFESLSLKHDQMMNRLIVPALKHFGIELPGTENSDNAGPEDENVDNSASSVRRIRPTVQGPRTGQKLQA